MAFGSDKIFNKRNRTGVPDDMHLGSADSFDEGVAYRAMLAKRSADMLDPGVHLAIAQSTRTYGEAVTFSEAAIAVSNTLAWKASLQQQDEDVQVHWWENMTKQRRQLLTVAGYRPPHHMSPAARDASRTIASQSAITVASGATKAVKGAFGFVSDVADFVTPESVEDVVGGTLHRAGSPLRLVQRAYRTGHYMQSQYAAEHDLSQSDPRVFHHYFSAGPDEWADAWREVEHGERTFDPVNLERARKRYGDETVELAKRLAGGETPEEIIDGIEDQDDKVAMAQRLAPDEFGDEKLQEAVAFMEASKISFGRSLVDPALAVEHPALHQWMSGAADGLFSWELDPLNVVGKLAKANRVSKYMIESEDDIHRLFATNKAVQREANKVVEILTSDPGPRVTNAGADIRIQSNVARLMAEKPRWTFVAQDLADHGVDTVGKLERYLADQAGLSAIASGRLTGMHSREMTLPFLTRTGNYTEDFKNMTARGINLLSQARNPVVRWPSEFARKLVTQLPTRRTISVHGDEGVQVIGQTARMWLSDDAAREYQNLWAATTSIDQRRMLWVGMLENMAESAGINRDSIWWKEVVGNAGQGVYSGTGLDKMANGAREAFRVPHLATRWAVPDYREWYRAGTKSRMLGLNSRAMDWFMSELWKPAVLLRPAFAIRAGGEELFQAIMRDGWKVPQALAARSAVKGSAPILPDAAIYHPLRSVWRGFTRSTNVSPQMIAMLETPSDFMTMVIANRARSAMRYVNRKLAGETYFRYARELANDPAYQNALARDVSSKRDIGGFGDAFMQKALERGDIVIPDGSRLRATGEFREYRGGHDYHPYAWHGTLDEIAHDPPSRAVLRAMNDLGPVRPSQVEIGGFRAAGDMDEAWRLRREELIRVAERSIKSPSFKKYRSAFHRNAVDGRTGLPVEAPRPEAVPIYRVEDAVLSHSLASTNMKTGVVRIDRAALAENYRLGMRHERGAAGTAGSAQKAEVFRQQNIDVSDLQAWFDANGGVRAYQKFIIEHERAHLLLGHTGTAVDDFGSAASIRKEIEANNVAFKKLDMPFGNHDDHGSLVTDRLDDATGFATEEAALRSWAEVIVDDTLANLPHPEQGFNHTLAQRILDGDIPGYDEIGEMSRDLLPEIAKGPGYAIVHTNVMRAAVDRTFEEFVGVPMDWMVREPMLLHKYAEARIRLERLAEKTPKLQWTDADVHDLALHKAVNDVIPMIDRSEVRSQFSSVFRNVFPFWFAQEQFYKRLVRTAAYNPTSFRKVQLTLNGLKHVGFITKDEHGNDVFMYPVVGRLASEFLVRQYGLRGVDSSQPLPVGFSGQVTGLAPGIDRVDIPSFAPWVVVGTSFLAARYPELNPVAEKAAQGFKRRPYWEQVMPATVTRLYHALADDPETSTQMMSADLMAMQYLDVAGAGYPENGSAREKDEWESRIQQWGRSLFLIRTLVGFGAPAAPTIVNAADVIHPELIELFRTLGFNDGMEEFIRRHPDWSAYQVFPTKSATGGALPATAEAKAFMEEHKGVIGDYPAAGGWFIPQPTEKNPPFEPEAYNMQLELMLRQGYETLGDARDAIMFSRDKGTYFAAKQQYEDFLDTIDPDDKVKRRGAEAVWLDWARQYKAAHPVFAEMLESPDRRDKRRDVLADVRKIVEEDRLPDTQHAANIAAVVQNFDAWRRAVDENNVSTKPGKTKRRERIDAVFFEWAHDLLVSHPELDAFYRAIIAPDYDKEYAEAGYGR